MRTARDKAIVKDLRRFRCMDRDSIATLHFQDVKNPERSANNVLLRLLRDGEITRSNLFVPYVYFPSDTQIKKTSQKVPHFLAILGVYKELKQRGNLGAFVVEPKYLPKSKSAAEPDIYCQYRGKDFFVEVQRTVYSQKLFDEKMQRYVELYNSGVMGDTFPYVLIVTDHQYAIPEGLPFRVFQSHSFTEFERSLKPKQQPPVVPQQTTGIRIVVK